MSAARGWRAGRLVVWASALCVVCFLAWAHWARLDQITRAGGQVIASARNQVIQATEGGVLVEMPVREGARVARGQLLARFDSTKAEAAHRESLARAAALKATIARLKAEIFGGAPAFPPELQGYAEFRSSQMALFAKRQGALREEIASLERAEALIKEELELNLPLVKTGDVARADVIRLQRQIVDARSQITNRRNKYLQDCQAELVKAEEELAGVEQIVAQRREQLALTEVLAPMDGTVRNVRLTTLGGVARPGDEIMQIVPGDDELVVEAKVRPADIAFLKTGLPATVKFDAYDYSIYGALTGQVAYISPDTLTEAVQGVEQAYYRLQVRTAGPGLRDRQGQPIQIQPGMTATVEIRTGDRTVLEYLTKPITKTLSASMGER